MKKANRDLIIVESNELEFMINSISPKKFFLTFLQQ